MPKPDVILLNGASSSGKSSLAKALQEKFAEIYLFFTVDFFLHMCPARLHQKEQWEKEEARIVSGLHEAAAGFVKAGNRIIFDHVLLKPEWLNECVKLFDGYNVLLVGVMCPLEELLRREKARGDRPDGMAETQHGFIHDGKKYDLEVDTSLHNPDECADIIINFIEKNQVY